MKNANILKEFEKLLKQKEWEFNQLSNRQDKIKKAYSINNTKNALSIIKKFPKIIKGQKELNELNSIKGIGKKTIDRINEIINKGKLSEIKNYTQSNIYYNAMTDLEEVIGIGKVKAHSLITKHNITSVDQLITLHKNGKIKLNDKILLGLKYHNVYKQHIPRTKIIKIDSFLNKTFSQIDTELFGVICGSYRREKLYSGDIDVLITHPKIKTMNQLLKHKKNYLREIVKHLKKSNFLVDDMTDKNITTKYMGFCKYKNNPVWRIDFRYIPSESYYTALLYFTGSGRFNMRIRELAISLGYKLSEYGLYEIDDDKNIIQQIKINSEKEIFDYLGLEYIKPSHRTE